MKLSQLLEVIYTHRQIVIYIGAQEIKKSVYQIKWHHKDLLDKEVHSIIADNDLIYIAMKNEENQ